MKLQIKKSVLAVFSAGIFLLSTAVPQSANSQGKIQPQTPVVSPLDGMQFDAGIVRAGDGEDQERPLEDKLVFRGGNFSSVICERYNFNSAPYWIRREGDRIHFLVELSSPTDGTMVWKGTVREGKLSGTMRWTKNRWYWTIDTEHNIRGELSVSASSVSSPEK